LVGLGEKEHIEQRRRDSPRLVQVVAGEEDAVRDPVAASEDAVHTRRSSPRKSSSSPSTVLRRKRTSVRAY
jgi:hypothetical protein